MATVDNNKEDGSEYLDMVPPEVWALIFAKMTYDPSDVSQLRKVCKSFNAILNDHQHTIVKTVLVDQFFWAPRHFPGLLGQDTQTKPRGWDMLETMSARMTAIHVLESRGTLMRCNHSMNNQPITALQTQMSMNFHRAGLLLLFRLADCETTSAKIACMRSLPRTSLAILLFALTRSTKIFNGHVPELWTLRPHIQRNQETRSEINLAFHEALLRHGPQLLTGLLSTDDTAVSHLERELYAIDPFLDPDLDPDTDFAALHPFQLVLNPNAHPPTPSQLDPTTHFEHSTAPSGHGPDDSDGELDTRRSLGRTLSWMFSQKAGCGIEYCQMHMWYILDGECGSLACIAGEEKKAQNAIERVVNGEELEPGRRLIHLVQ